MDDQISRKAAIDALFDWEMTYDWDDHCREEDPKPEYIVSPSDVIKKLPSSQPMRPKGKWITDGYGNTLCSECRWYAPRIMQGSLATRRLEVYKSDFCWKCGADMRGDPNE